MIIGSMQECIFCQIVAGKLPSYKVYEDEEFLAFLDIFPKSTGHTLVIPKKHVEWVWDLPAGRQVTHPLHVLFRNHQSVTG